MFIPSLQLAFRLGISTKIDERVAAMEKMKSLPLSQLITYIYPDLYPVHYEIDYENENWPHPLQLSFANFERNGVYLLDAHDTFYLYICKSVHPCWLYDVFGVSHWNQIPDDGDHVQTNHAGHSANNGINNDAASLWASEVVPLPVLENRTSIGLRAFIDSLLESRPCKPHFFILR